MTNPERPQNDHNNHVAEQDHVAHPDLLTPTERNGYLVVGQLPPAQLYNILGSEGEKLREEENAPVISSVEGFNVRGVNPSELILRLHALNGVDMKTLERVMTGRTGLGRTRYVGDHEPLPYVLAHDNESVGALELEHTQLADFLRYAMAMTSHIESMGASESDSPYAFEYNGRMYTGKRHRMMGHEGSPFLDKTEANEDYVLTCIDNDSRMLVSGLSHYLIGRYGFYGGVGAGEKRIDPTRLAEFAGFTDISDEQQLKSNNALQLVSEKSPEFKELRHQAQRMSLEAMRDFVDDEALIIVQGLLKGANNSSAASFAAEAKAAEVPTVAGDADNPIVKFGIQLGNPNNLSGRGQVEAREFVAVDSVIQQILSKKEKSGQDAPADDLDKLTGDDILHMYVQAANPKLKDVLNYEGLVAVSIDDDRMVRVKYVQDVLESLPKTEETEVRTEMDIVEGEVRPVEVTHVRVTRYVDTPNGRYSIDPSEAIYDPDGKEVGRIR